MNMNFSSIWRMPQNIGANPDQAGGYTGFNVYPEQSNFYMDSSHQMEQWQQQQLQLNLPFQDFSQQNNNLLYNDYQLPIELTTTINRKGRAKVTESVRRQRQLRRNERERERQARLNSAFDVLRGSIPSFLAPYKDEQKLTQIETLRLAKYYIRSLKGMLEECEKEDAVCDDEEYTKGNPKPRTQSFCSSDTGSC